MQNGVSGSMAQFIQFESVFRERMAQNAQVCMCVRPLVRPDWFWKPVRSGAMPVRAGCVSEFDRGGCGVRERCGVLRSYRRMGGCRQWDIMRHGWCLVKQSPACPALCALQRASGNGSSTCFPALSPIPIARPRTTVAPPDRTQGRVPARPA